MPNRGRASRLIGWGGWLLVLGVACLPLIRYGGAILADTHIGLATDPDSMLRLLGSTWNTRGSLGYDYTRSQALAFPAASSFWLIRNLGIGAGFATQVWIAAILLTAGAGMRYFVRTWKGKIAQLTPLLSSLAYMTSSYVIVLITDTSMLLIGYALLPFQMGLTLRLVRQDGSRLAGVGLLAVTFLLVSAADLPILVINATTVLLFALGYIFLNRRNGHALQRLFSVSAGVFLGFALLMWALIPLTVSYGTDPTPASENLATEGSGLYNRSSSYAEVSRLQGYWALYSGYAARPYRPYQAYYLENPVALVAGYVLVSMAVIGIIVRRREATTLLLGLGLVLTLPIVVGVYPPDDPVGTGKVVAWLFNTIPLAAIFRNTFKFAGVTTFTVIALAASALHHISTSGAPRASTRSISSVLAIGMIAAIGYPFFVGRVWWPEKLIERIPQDWYDLGDWLDSRPDTGRVLYLPDVPAPVYLWGFPTAEPGEVLVDRPQVYGMPGTLSPVGDRFLTFLYEELSELDARRELDAVLSSARIKYLVIRRDIRYGYYSGALPPYAAEAALRAIPGITYVRTFGDLDVYTVTAQPDPSVAAYSRVRLLDGTGNPILDHLIVLHGAGRQISPNENTLDEGGQLFTTVTPTQARHPLRVTSLASTRYDVELADKGQWTLLTLREAYHGTWSAFIPGREDMRLRHVLVDGYANGWLLPPGFGRVTIVHEPSRLVGPARGASILTLALVLVAIGFGLRHARTPPTKSPA